MRFRLLFAAIAAIVLGVAVMAENEESTLLPGFPQLEESRAAALTDGDYMTAEEFEAFSLTVAAEKEIKAAYIVWNENPQEYTVSTGGEVQSFDGEFLHQTVIFGEPVTEFAVDMPFGGEICDIYVFEDTDFPEFVQTWQEPCKQADIMILSAHGDDEFLMFGGTIPYYAKELGLKVQVAYMTTHWDEQPRPHEVLDGLWAAGVRNYPVIGIIPDIPYQPIWTLSEAMALYDTDGVLEWFVEQVRRFKPSVLITHDVNGEYGHGAHKLAAKIVMDAVELTGDTEQFPDSAELYGVWDVPKTYLHFWQENAITMDWEITLESFGGITAREAAQYCYGFHRSQHVWGYSVNYGEDWDCRQFGLYRTLVGVDESADFMEHISPLPEETTETEPAETEPAETTAEETTVSEVQTEAVAQEETVVTEDTTAENAAEVEQGGGLWVYVVTGVGLVVVAAVGVVMGRWNGRKK